MVVDALAGRRTVPCRLSQTFRMMLTVVLAGTIVPGRGIGGEGLAEGRPRHAARHQPRGLQRWPPRPSGVAAPCTLGTATGLGPRDTCSTTVDAPAAPVAPAPGSVPMTRPAFTVSLYCFSVLGLQP